MKNLNFNAWILKAVALLLLLNLSGCGYNNFQTLDEEAKASWSEVLNQYQRRADLVPNLVNVVKGYASHDAAQHQRQGCTTPNFYYATRRAGVDDGNVQTPQKAHPGRRLS